jgi:predicted ATPase
MTEQPNGTVTLVFTDIEGSTRLLEELGQDGYRSALAEHRQIVREAFGRSSGYEVDYEGDAFFYAFASASDAVAAVSDAMAGLESGPIEIRVGVHTGEPGLDPPKYVGLDVHLAARIMSSGHGGQVLLSQTTRELVSVEVANLGEHRLKDIEEAISLYQLGSERFPPLKTISNTNLPRPASSFVGRDDELLDVLSCFEEGARLVTLTGPGGTGKTRLAIEAAAELVPDFKAGVFWVGLASLRDSALVSETIAQTLGAKDGLHEHISDRELLLLLDNLEQVINVAPELATLLEACPNLKLLVTSRELLRVRGEVEYAVPPLAESEAVSLFCARSQLEPDETTAELCRRLDNLPLAVELAAARTSVLTPQQILERLSQRLDLLKGSRDADPRQQTLRATIEWSHELLSPEEQQLFARLSVFSGGCTLEAAEEVCDADLDTLAALVEKSLLRFTDERYWMLETIREYAVQQLDAVEETERLRCGHTEYFAAVARQESTEYRGSSREGGDRLEDERDNLRIALSRAFARADIDLAYELAIAYGLLCIYRGPQTEGRMWLDGALRITDGVAPRLREKALGIASDLAKRQGDLEAGRLLAEERLELARVLGDSDTIGTALDDLGIIECYAGNFDRGEELQREAVAVFTASANDIKLRHALGMLGFLLFARGAYAEAREVCEDALTMSRAAGDSRGVGIAASHLGNVLAHEGNFHEALLLQREALLMAQELRDVQAIGAVLLDVAVLAISLQDYESAGEMLGAVAGLAESNEFALVSVQVDLFDETLEVLRQQFGGDDLDRITARGRQIQFDEIVGHIVEFIDSRA